MSCAVVAPDSCASAQIATSLSAASGFSGARQQAEHDQARDRDCPPWSGRAGGRANRGSAAADRAGDEEEHAGADRGEAEEIDVEGHALIARSAARGEAMTKATEAKLDSSANPSATFSTPATSVAAAASSSARDRRRCR